MTRARGSLCRRDYEIYCTLLLDLPPLPLRGHQTLTPRYDVATDKTVARSGKFGLRCEIDFITQTRHDIEKLSFNFSTVIHTKINTIQFKIDLKMLPNDQQL